MVGSLFTMVAQEADIDFVHSRSCRDMSTLSSQQKASVFKKAKDRLAILEEKVPSESIPAVPFPAEKSKECASCLRLSSKEFFHGSSKAVSLSTQLHHFDILLEDEHVLPSFREISEDAHKQILRKIIRAVLLAASGASYGTNWTHRSIALCAAMEALRIEELMAPSLSTTSFDQISNHVDNHLGTFTTQNFLRSLITGVAFEDVRVMARFPIPASLPDTSFIISPRFIHEKYQEMITFGKKLDPEGTITATLWAIVGVVAATGTQPLSKAKIPREPAANQATKQTTGEVPAEDQELDGDAETEVIGENGKSKQPTAERAKRAEKATRTATSDEAEEKSEEEDHRKKSTVRKSRSSTSSTTITQSTNASKRSSGRGSTLNTKKRKLGDSDVQATPLTSQRAQEGTRHEQGAGGPRRAAAERAKEVIIDGYAGTAQGWSNSEEGAPLSTAAWAPRAGPSSARVPPSPVSTVSRIKSVSFLYHNVCSHGFVQLQVSNRTRLVCNSPKASPREDHVYDEDLN